MFYTNQYEQQISNENQSPLLKNDIETAKISRSTAVRSNKQLPDKAIRLMNAWYLSHEDNPYPNRNDLDYLATNGGIKESQVKAWFSNKRNRTQNTHPKRAKRYLNRNANSSEPTQWNEPEKIHIADQFQQRLNPTNWSYMPTQSYDYAQYYYNS